MAPPTAGQMFFSKLIDQKHKREDQSHEINALRKEIEQIKSDRDHYFVMALYYKEQFEFCHSTTIGGS